MGAHCTDRITEGGAVLDAQPINGVSVVAAPDLRRVVEHTAVKPASSPAAPLNQDIGIIPVQPLQQIINA